MFSILLQLWMLVLVQPNSFKVLFRSLKTTQSLVLVCQRYIIMMNIWEVTKQQVLYTKLVQVLDHKLSLLQIRMMQHQEIGLKLTTMLKLHLLLIVLKEMVFILVQLQEIYSF